MKIRELLDDESKWCKGHWALKADGKFTSYDDPEAVKWCLVGAMQKCYPYEKDYNTTYKKAFNHLNLAHDVLSEFNDRKGTSFDDIKQLVDELDI